jgi:hypothetical protein
MTDRYTGFVVSLETDMRSDDAEATIAAIRQIKGVIGIEPVQASIETQIARQQVRLDLERKLWEALHE